MNRIRSKKICSLGSVGRAAPRSEYTMVHGLRDLHRDLRKWVFFLSSLFMFKRIVLNKYGVNLTLHNMHLLTWNLVNL